MDFSPYFSTNVQDESQVRYTRDMRTNRDPRTVFLRAYLGARDGRQVTALKSAISLAQSHFAERGFNLISEDFHNDQIKNDLHLSPQAFIDKLLEADVHMGQALLHESNIGKTPDWNINNIHAAVDRLKYHIGSPMGKYVDCPGLRGDKYSTYELLGEDYCLPTLKIELPEKTWSVGYFSPLAEALIDRLVTYS
jgi:hypothetical protein